MLIADVDNPTMHTISVEEVDAVLLREGKEFVRFTLEGTPSAGPGTRRSGEDSCAGVGTGPDFDHNGRP